MADFEKSFQKLIINEGNYDNDSNDPGKETYKGISRVFNPYWLGWKRIDTAKSQPNFPGSLENDSQLQSLVKIFYKTEYWEKLKCDAIINQDVAFSLFDFAVNAGAITAIKIAQKACGANPDGEVGVKTLYAINKINPEYFIDSFKVEKVKRYIEIVEQTPSQMKYFYGWIRRAIL